MIKEALIKLIGEYNINPTNYEPVDVVWICACIVLIVCIIGFMVFLGKLIKG